MKTTRLKVLVTDEDGTLRDSVVIDLESTIRNLNHDPRAIMDAADEATELVRDEITSAIVALRKERGIK